MTKKEFFCSIGTFGKFFVNLKRSWAKPSTAFIFAASGLPTRPDGRAIHNRVHRPSENHSNTIYQRAEMYEFHTLKSIVSGRFRGFRSRQDELEGRSGKNESSRPLLSNVPLGLVQLLFKQKLTGQTSRLTKTNHFFPYF